MKKILLLLIISLLVTSCGKTVNNVELTNNDMKKEMKVVDDIKNKEIEKNRVDVILQKSTIFLNKIKNDTTYLESIDCNDLEKEIYTLCILEKKGYYDLINTNSGIILGNEKKTDKSYNDKINNFIQKISEDPNYIEEVECLNIEDSELKVFCEKTKIEYYNSINK